MKKLRLGLPAGSLQERTLALFHQAGYRITLNDRSYVPHIDDSELEGLLIRAQEIPHYVEAGVLDAGITGLDWIKERDAAVVEVAELAYSRHTDRPARWVLAVPDDSPIQRPEDLQGKRIATEIGALHPALSGGAWRGGRGRVLLGSDRGQGAGVGRRDCRTDRNRLFPARQPAPHRCYAARIDAAAGSTCGGVGQFVEAGETGESSAPVAGRAPSERQGRPEDEPPRQTSWSKSPHACRLCTPPRSPISWAATGSPLKSSWTPRSSVTWRPRSSGPAPRA